MIIIFLPTSPGRNPRPIIRHSGQTIAVAWSSKHTVFEKCKAARILSPTEGDIAVCWSTEATSRRLHELVQGFRKALPIPPWTALSKILGPWKSLRYNTVTRAIVEINRRSERVGTKSTVTILEMGGRVLIQVSLVLQLISPCYYLQLTLFFWLFSSGSLSSTPSTLLLDVDDLDLLVIFHYHDSTGGFLCTF